MYQMIDRWLINVEMLIKIKLTGEDNYLCIDKLDNWKIYDQ